MAVRSQLGPTQPRRRWTADHGGIAACGVHRGPRECHLRARLRLPEESVLSRRRSRPDADPRLGRRLDVAAERLCGGRPHDRRRRRRGQFRPRAQSAAGRQGRRPQLPGHVQCGGFAADLDAADERHHRARRLRRNGMRGAIRRRSRRSRWRPGRSGDRSTTPSRRRRAATSRGAAA